MKKLRVNCRSRKKLLFTIIGEIENVRKLDDLKNAESKISSLTLQTDIAFEDMDIEIKYHYEGQYGTNYRSVKTSLVEIFKIIATEMMDVSVTESFVESAIKSKYLSSTYGKYLDDNQFVKKLLNQYRALNLVYSKWSDKNKSLYWRLTEKGCKVRDDMILLKNK